MSWKDTVKVNKGLLSSWTNQMNMKTINESYAGKSLNGVPYREKAILWMKSCMESVIIRVEVILGILSIWNNLTGYSMDSKSKGVHVCLAISRNYV